MNKTPDPENIASAMRDAAWVATHGTREERSGKFLPSGASPAGKAPESKSAAARHRASANRA